MSVMRMLASSLVPWEPGASLSLYPPGNCRYHFLPIKLGANGGPRAGRQAGLEAGYKEYYQEMLPCLATRENCRAHSREAGPVFTLYVATPGSAAGAASINHGT